MPLRREVGVGPVDIMSDGDPGPSPPPQKKCGTASAIFGPRRLWPNGWMNQDDISYGVGLVPGDIVLDGGPSPPPEKGHNPPLPHFSAHVYCGQTVAHLRYC